MSKKNDDTVVIGVRVDKETDASIAALAAELKYPKSTVAGLILRIGARWAKAQIIEAHLEGAEDH